MKNYSFSFKNLVYLQHKISSIHNKDYSVVKTFKVGALGCSRFFCTYLNVYII